MLSNLKLILGGALAMLMFGGGYSLGARKVDALEAQIESIKNAGNEAEAKLKKSQEDIAKTLKDKEAEYAKQAQQLKTAADQRTKDLAAALAGATGRIATLQAQVSSVDARRTQLVAELSAASEAEKKKLKDQIATLDQEKKALVAKVDANECLALAVPAVVIGPLVERR